MSQFSLYHPSSNLHSLTDLWGHLCRMLSSLTTMVLFLPSRFCISLSVAGVAQILWYLLFWHFNVFEVLVGYDWHSLFFFSKLLVAFYEPLFFCAYFIISLSSVSKYLPEILYGIALKLWIEMERIDIKLNPSIREYHHVRQFLTDEFLELYTFCVSVIIILSALYSV